MLFCDSLVSSFCSGSCVCFVLFVCFVFVVFVYSLRSTLRNVGVSNKLKFLKNVFLDFFLSGEPFNFFCHFCCFFSIHLIKERSSVLRCKICTCFSGEYCWFGLFWLIFCFWFTEAFFLSWKKKVLVDLDIFREGRSKWKLQ